MAKSLDVEGFKQSLHALHVTPVSGICQRCGRVVPDLDRHHCDNEDEPTFWEELLSVQKSKYHRAQSYAVE